MSSLHQTILTLGDGGDGITGMSLGDLIKIIPTLSGFTVLFVISYLGYQGKLVRGADLERMRQERDEWKEVALRSITNNERAVANVERAATVVEQTIKTTGMSAATGAGGQGQAQGRG